MSGEFLRGVLTGSTPVARLKTYSVTTSVLSVVGTRTTQSQKIETGTMFLLMQANMILLDTLGVPYKTSNQKFTIKKASNSFSYSANSLIYSAYTPCINQTCALPEYPLLDQNEYIVLDWECKENPPAAGARMVGIFSGIEYRKG